MIPLQLQATFDESRIVLVGEFDESVVLLYAEIDTPTFLITDEPGPVFISTDDDQSLTQT